MILSIGIHLKLLEDDFSHSSKDILCQLTGIFTLVHVNHDFPDEGPLHLSRPG